MPKKNNHELDRNMGFFAAFSIGTGTMIGAGIFVLPKIAISNAGPAVILSFLLGGLISLATTGMIFVAYLGIAKMAAISEEVKNPGKNLPRAFISSVIFVTLLYLGVMFVINGLLPFDEVVSTNSPLLDAAEFLAGKVGFVAMIIAGFFATVSTANAALLSSSRFPFAMGPGLIMIILFFYLVL